MASESLRICEEQPASLAETTEFVDGYTLRGLGLFYSESDYAVDDLQNAARLAADELTQIRCLNNLGAVFYMVSRRI